MAIHIETKMPNKKTFRYISGYPLVGNLPEFSKDRLGLFQRIARAGDVYGLHFGPFPGILFNKPEHVHHLALRPAGKVNVMVKKR